ncbi:hypothetical protein ACFFF5_21180 [Lederbergia wuyishanensis]|uniref:Uncharacterized protein n=1 Tax=Lederbergia wuyishanensis TaxID=1347903 RepID=A0ABU0D770_9BACI|nr:hypothetical protein [Lederbergia wuyishanensis]MCJ8008930.1 hypothetical protein [Lederbergia wuyishanensis]MDQ0344256.1 hypothetical protein [Lederbergia wuyishanensis]
MDKSVQSNKDIISTSITITNNKDSDPVDVIAEKFIDLRTVLEGREVHPNVKDYEAIARIVARGMPLPQTIKLLEQCFHEYAEREPEGAIKAFSYCEKYITDHYAKMEAAEKARQLAKRRLPENGKHEHKRSTRKTSTKNDSITGEQVGRIRRRTV